MRRAAFPLCRRMHTRVASFGDGSNGALGHADSFISDAYEPTPVQGLPQDIVRVACGHYHSLAVTRSGEVWSWGRNSEGQLGRGYKSNLSLETIKPQKVKGLEGLRIRQAAASGVTSLAISEDGCLYSWGSSKRGQLGLGVGVLEALLPSRVHALQEARVSKVSLGWGHALACTEQGELYSWGYEDNGRLGYALPRDSASVELLEEDHAGVKEQLQKELRPVLQWEPRRVQLSVERRAVDVSCGLDHSLVVFDDGVLVSFGDNSTQQLGRKASGAEVGIVEGELTGRRVIQASGGWGHSLALAEDCSSGRRGAFSWGWSDSYQLGRDAGKPSSVPMRVEQLEHEDVVKVCAGRVHSMCLTAAGRVWTWGSGKNGRLGAGYQGDHQLPTMVDTPEDTKVADAASGFDHALLLLVEC